MKKGLIVFALMISFILGGCDGGQTLLFTGQSQHWKGDYTTNVTRRTEDGEFTIKYKNGGNPTFKNLVVDIQAYHNHMLQKSTAYKGSVIKMSSSGTGVNPTKSNQTFKVTIIWDNKHKETFTLKPKKSNY